MSGKEQFKEVRNSYLDGITSEYSVGKEAAYVMLATMWNVSISAGTAGFVPFTIL